MFRKAGCPRPPSIELKELPSARPASPRERTGYSPPQFLRAPSRSLTGSSLTMSTVTNSPAPPSEQAGVTHRRPLPAADPVTHPLEYALGRVPPSPVGGGAATDVWGGGNDAETETETITETETGTETETATATETETESTTTGTDNEAAFRAAVGERTVDLDELRRVLWAGGSPSARARSLAWQLLTGYLPPDRGDWESSLRASRARYWSLVAQHACAPGRAGGDHPLCAAAGSQWGAHFADAGARAQIALDAARTHPGAARFDGLRDALQRVLFVHAKEAAPYRQGMHELAAPLLVVCAEASAFRDGGDAEADAFFCLEAVMREMQQAYADGGAGEWVARQLREMRALLRVKDPRVEAHLAAVGVDVAYFGARWMRLWLAQEFPLEDLLRVWDSLLAAEQTLPWLRFVCVAMIVRIRDRLLAEDFAGCMKMLLHYPAGDVDELLRIADRLRMSNLVFVRSVRR